MANEYEILFIIKANLSKEKIQETCEKFQSWITNNEGEVTLFKEWGQRDLATEFSKMNKGYYVQCQFKATQKTLDEINRNLHVNEDIFRHMTVTMESINMPEIQKREEHSRA